MEPLFSGFRFVDGLETGDFRESTREVPVVYYKDGKTFVVGHASFNNGVLEGDISEEGARILKLNKISFTELSMSDSEVAIIPKEDE